MAARVAILEPSALGGTCVNVGCVPKKAMWLAADLVERIDLARAVGFAIPEATLSWAELVAHRQGYIGNIHASYRRRLDADGVVLIPRRGRLVDAHTVECDDGVRVSANHVVIATGAHPLRPQIEGADLGLVSDDFFNLCEAPPRVAIVGGGYIAVELAGLLQALGSRGGAVRAGRAPAGAVRRGTGATARRQPSPPGRAPAFRLSRQRPAPQRRGPVRGRRAGTAGRQRRQGVLRHRAPPQYPRPGPGSAGRAPGRQARDRGGRLPEHRRAGAVRDRRRCRQGRPDPGGDRRRAQADGPRVRRPAAGATGLRERAQRGVFAFRRWARWGWARSRRASAMAPTR